MDAAVRAALAALSTTELAVVAGLWPGDRKR